MFGWILVALPLAGLAFAARRVLARLFVVALLRSVYKIRAFDAHHVPVSGGALLVPNHVSMIDGLWVGAALPRLVYFLMHRDFIRAPVIGPFARMMGTIPVATGDSPEEKAESLRRAGERCASGDLVCIFAEGVITRSGALMPFMRGLEKIAQAGRAPIVPVALDRVWGSLFSFSGGKFLWKKPRRLPFPIDVVFGAPLPPDTPAWRVRDAVQELLARHREARADELRPMAYRFFRSARRHARSPALVVAGGSTTTYGELVRDVLAWQSAWQTLRAERELVPGARIATFLPHGRDTIALHVALALERELVLPLENALGEVELAELATRARVELLVAPRAVLDARGPLASAFAGRRVALEELAERARAARTPLDALATRLPGPLLARIADPARGGRTPLVATFVRRRGVRRAVVLSHANLASNVQSLAQTFDFGPDDRVLATVPLDDALGHLAALWLPLTCGAAIVVPRSLTDARTLAEDCQRERVTVLPLAAAQVRALLEVAEPAQLASVRCAFCDGSAVDVELIERWRARFGSPLHPGWGLAELAPVVSISLHDIDSGAWHHAGSKPRAVGRALSGVALRVVDAHGELLPPGETGELRVRGPGVMLGYLDDPEATARVLADGWFATGRRATLDKDGFLFLAEHAAS